MMHVTSLVCTAQCKNIELSTCCASPSLPLIFTHFVQHALFVYHSEVRGLF